MKQGRFVVDLQGVELPVELYNEIEAKINDVVLTSLAKFPSPTKDRSSIFAWGKGPEWRGIWLRYFKNFEDFNKNQGKVKESINGVFNV
jgi:hypothetical protein